MNTKIFKLLSENLNHAFKLPKYQGIVIDQNTVVDQLPWTPARYRKFKQAMESELGVPVDLVGTLADVTHRASEDYIKHFFSQVWQPRTDDYSHTGWALADEVNRLNPQAVLDVGCGYHPFKSLIKNIVGIDPYNSAADYQVDILEYNVKPESYDVIIALGSINFNTRDEIEQKFGHCVNLLAPGGRFYLRANPGIPHKTGPYVDIFPWSFSVVNDFAQQFGLELLEFKKDVDRLYFVYQKNH